MKDCSATYSTDRAALIAALLSALEPCVAIVDPNGKLIVSNPSWRAFARRSVGRENQPGDLAILLDAQFPAAAPHRQNRQRVEGLMRVINGETDYFDIDCVPQAGLVERWYRVRAHRFDQPPGRALLIIDDITSQKQTERDFRNSQDQLYQAQKMEALGTLVAGMAHEINNPISLIMFNLPIVKRVWQDALPVLQQVSAIGPPQTFGGYPLDFLETQFHQLIADMIMAANRISKIVEDLSNFSRRSQMRDTQEVKINDAAAAAVRLAQTTIRKSGVQLKLDLTGDLPPIQGNLTGIEQVILNVIINAIQGIDHENGRIAIRTGENRAAGEVFITVGDNGRGIAPEMADKLFDPFVTDKQDQGGTGLGLAVSYSLVKAHDGDIAFEPSEEGGTVFTVTLPTEPQPKVTRVLVVDDDAMVRNLITQALRETEHYHVDEAANGVDGLIKIGADPPDLLILDLMMPGMNGLEVCQTIHRKKPFAAMKVMITTGHPHHADLKKISALGFTKIHTKPFTIAGFLQAIEAIMVEDQDS